MVATGIAAEVTGIVIAGVQQTHMDNSLTGADPAISLAVTAEDELKARLFALDDAEDSSGDMQVGQALLYTGSLVAVTGAFLGGRQSVNAALERGDVVAGSGPDPDPDLGDAGVSGPAGPEL
jgi:hypothetical protein